jgi:DNA-binding response OmpR family regulator
MLRRLDERRAGPDRSTSGKTTTDISVREAWIDGNPLQLTTIEFALLEVLVRNAGRVLSRDYLTDTSLERKLGAFDRTIDVHISNLRMKLDSHAGLDHIKSARGSGYLLGPRRSNEEH